MKKNNNINEELSERSVRINEALVKEVTGAKDLS